MNRREVILIGRNHECARIKNKFNVLVIRANYIKAYPVIESLKRAGYTVVVGIDRNSNLISSEGLSRFSDRIAYIANPYQSEKAYVSSIIQALREYDIDIIVPIGFIDFLLASKYKNHIEKYAIVPTDSYEKIEALSNKWNIKNLAGVLGINFPESLLLSGGSHTSSIKGFANSVGFPIVVKGLGDNSEPKFVGDFNALLSAIPCRIKNGVLVQEFIPGIGVGYFVLSYCGEPMAEFMHRRIFEATPFGGASIKATSSFDSELFRLGRKIVKKASWTGVMMVEFKKEAETGDLYLMEINPKFWGSLELAYRAGVDFPRYLVDFYLKGERPKQVLVKDIGFSWISSGLSSYSEYGFKTNLEVTRIIAPKTPLFSDLHLHDPPNFAIKFSNSSLSFLRSFASKTCLETVYLTKMFQEAMIKTNTIISDLDGTMVKLNIPWSKALHQALILGLIERGKNFNESFTRNWVMNKREAFAKLGKLVEEYELKAVNNVEEDKYLLDALKGLRDNSIRFVVVSKQSKKSVAQCLRGLGLLDYVGIIIGREDSPIRFEQLQIAIKEVKACINEKCEVVMFGDTLVDVRAAFKAGLIPCVVTSHNIGRIQAKELDLSYTDNISKILKILLNIKTKSKEKR
jgi:phosphoglycolate phosphatase-like HAD superfamily hydrolase/predicted ATP-grasp superfamily ATP-dependent carboligase